MREPKISLLNDHELTLSCSFGSSTVIGNLAADSEAPRVGMEFVEDSLVGFFDGHSIFSKSIRLDATHSSKRLLTKKLLEHSEKRTIIKMNIVENAIFCFLDTQDLSLI